MKSAENIALSLVSVIAIAFLTSCSATKYLQPGETFLEANAVTIKSKERVRNKKTLQVELEQKYLQQETETWLGIPRHTFYYEAQKKPQDTTGINRWLMNRGDPPVILDSSMIQGTIDNMILVLHQRGYWNGTVDYRVETEGNRSRVNYFVDPMRRWTVRSIKYTTRDTVVQYILDTILHDSHLAPSNPVDVDLYQQEKARVTLALQNLGFANFFPNYITEPLVDSSNYQMDLEIEVNTPPDSDHHTRYTIGKVSAYPDSPADTVYRDTTINGVTFHMTDTWPVVKAETIARNVYLKPGDLYTRSAYEKTQRQLGRLEIYRFISLKPSVDLQDSALLNYNLTMTRNKLMGVGGDIELNYSTLAATVSRTLIGLSGRLNYRHRNLFQGAELFSMNVESGVEVNLGRTVSSRVNSANFNVQNDLLIPRFIDPIRFYRFINELWPGRNGFLGDRTYRWLAEGNTNIGLGYQFLSLFELYDYHSFTASMGYDAQPDLQRRLQLNHIGIDVFLPETKPKFDSILDHNRFLRESFRKQLFTGFLFRDYRFTQTGRNRPRGINVSLTHSAEVSGLEIFGINTLYNSLADQSGGFEIGSGEKALSFSQFAKFEVDTRVRHVISPSQELAFRFATGLAFPYGPFTQQVPYIKQFYVGGPSSIRAWQIRELGPGGFQDPFNNPDGDLPFYQTGDIKIEGAAEYRFDIAWIFEGALFVDAGNVWTVQDDPTRPGAVFSSKFMKQIAVGTGLGLRMDFTYFRIRLDFGYKLRNPYPIEGKYWLFDNFKDFSFQQFTTNFAIGYPF